MTKFDFRDLFIFEIANNHQGSVRHGKELIGEMARIAKQFEIRAAIKLQFRDLDTFIHPAHQIPGVSTNKHVARFLNTQLSWADYAELVDETRHHGLITMCTPFDEPSVDRIRAMGFDVIKIGSPSNTDWPLIERVAEAQMPVIFSTGGLQMGQIDDLVRFFDKRGVDYAIMHCVSLYPTPDYDAQLNHITALRERYPKIVIGYSTHEAPHSMAVHVAVAKGARMFEKHVDLDHPGKNRYSATPAQVDAWLRCHREAYTLCQDRRVSEEEKASLAELQRGVYAKVPIHAGPLRREDVYFAMPRVEGQMSAGAWKVGMRLKQSYKADEAVRWEGVEIPSDPYGQILKDAASQVRAMLAEARIPLPQEFKLEFSHHEGIVRFPYVGATIIEIVNREYCQKLIIMTPGQRHPNHAHEHKEEMFRVLWGQLYVVVGNEARVMKPGDTHVIERLQRHEFWTTDGAIVEEISTRDTHDSFYADPLIAAIPREQRKTIVEGRA